MDNDTVWEHDEARGSLGKQSRDTTPMYARTGQGVSDSDVYGHGPQSQRLRQENARTTESGRRQEVYRTVEDLLDFWFS